MQIVAWSTGRQWSGKGPINAATPAAGRDSDATRPSPPGGVPYGPDPISKKKKEKSDRKDFFLSNKDCEENSHYPDSLAKPEEQKPQ